MARINLLDLLPGGRRGVNTACAEAVWKHNVSVYRKNINTSSPLWVIDGGTGQGQPRAGRVTESQELARKMDPMEMNLRGHRSGQVVLGTPDPPSSALHGVAAHSRYLPHTASLWVGKGGGKGSFQPFSVYKAGASRYRRVKCPHLQDDAESQAKLLLHVKISKAYFVFATVS